MLWSILRVGNLNWNQGLAIEMQLNCTFASTSLHLHLITLVACLLCWIVDTSGKWTPGPLVQHRGILATGAMDLGEMQLNLQRGGVHLLLSISDLLCTNC